MIRQALCAAALLAAAPAAAQAQQDELDARYERALAVGYEALMTCGAIANAERAGGARDAESVIRWELTGIQSPLDEIVPAMVPDIVRGPDGRIRRVAVAFAADMPPRFAVHRPGAGCSVAPIGADPETFTLPAGAVAPQLPGDARAWPQVKPHEGTRPLDRVVASALGGGFGEGSRTTGVVVVEGTIISGEAYAPDFDIQVPQRTWSVAKSIAATLIGAAVQRGEIDVAAPAPIAAWSTPGDPRGGITTDNLLRMASGRYSDTPGNRTDPLYFGGATVDERAATWPLIHRPGTVYRYANNDTLMAVKAIAPTFADHPPAELFAKLGMADTVAETDWQGNYILSSQVWSTARDLARLGQLYLQDGVWNDERILPEGWAEYVSSPSGPQPEGPFGYGAGFWLFNHSEGVPPDAFAAMGNRGQYVVIVPSRDVVIVRRGEDPADSRFDIAAFTRDVLAALER